MKNFSWAAILLLFLFPACGKKVNLPRPDSARVDEVLVHQKEARVVDEFLHRIGKFEAEQDKLKQSNLTKREKGYNTAEAEKAISLVDEAVKLIKALLLERKFEELEIKIKETESLQKSIKNLIKKAPAFSDKPVKKEKIQRKYLDERDWVLENRGREPDKKEFRYAIPVRLTITDASPVLQQCKCWDRRMNQFVLDNPPIMESWYYLDGQTIYIFSEDNTTFQQFFLRNDLPPQRRDALLAELCEKQANFGGLKLLYVGPPVADLSSIMEQALTGRMRFSGMFGMEGMERKMLATAALRDLSVAAVAFNTEIDGLNRFQAEQFNKFYQFIKTLDPNVFDFLESQKEPKQEKSYLKADPSDKIIVKDKLEEVPGLTAGQPQLQPSKKRLEAFNKIFRWQRTLNPSDKDIKELVKLFPDKGAEISEQLNPFKETLTQLSKEFGKVRDSLVKFIKDFDELVFEQGKSIATFFLLDSVRFGEKVLQSGETVEAPDISVKITIELKPGKKSPSIPVGEIKEIKIDNANKFIDEVREYRRLASFGLRFPVMLSPGNYLVTFEISDNLRAQTIKYVITWLIRPQP